MWYVKEKAQREVEFGPFKGVEEACEFIVHGGVHGFHWEDEQDISYTIFYKKEE